MTNRKQSRSRRNRRGFTLVEILIVVIILGILAAIVIPQFTNASTDARKSSLATQLQSLQQQIAYYKLQHNNTLPPLTSGWTTLTEYTDIQGNVSATADSTHVYGPYFPTDPTNPLAPSATASNVSQTGVPDGASGWVYDLTTGKIYASGTDSSKYFNPADGTDSSTAPY